MMARAVPMIDMSLPIGSLDAYIARVNQIPMLSATEETELATNLKENNDLDSARQLVMAHLRFVVRVARGYMGYGLPLGDLIQEGNVGLMKAVRRFDPTVGVRLVSFAVHWIKAEIHEFVLRNWRIVKVATTKAQRKLFFNLRNMRSRLGWATQEEIQGVAEELGVKPEEVMVMEQRLNAADAPFDGPEGDDDAMAYYAPSQTLAAENADPAMIIESMDSQDQSQADLSQALAALDARSVDIVESRWLANDKATLHDLAEKYGVSAERIRQLEQNALKKLKFAIMAG